MTTIKMLDRVGTFASNKDIAKDIRTNLIIPTLSEQGEVVIDFDGVNGATQSFIHALISDAIREFGADAFLKKVAFKSCNDKVRAIVTIVTDYMQAGLDDN